MPQSISHPANIAPGLTGHEFLGVSTQAMSRFTDPFDTAFDGISGPFVLFERLTIHAGEIASDPLGILNHVMEAVLRGMPRRQRRDLAQYSSASAGSRPARGGFRRADQAPPQYVVQEQQAE